MLLLCIISEYKKNASIVDIGWGLGFVIIALFSLFYTHHFLYKQLLITILILMWGLRLSWHIGIRNWNKKEDPRYQEIKQKYGIHNIMRSFLLIFLPQALCMLIIGYPIMIINNSNAAQLTVFSLCACLMWTIGYTCEMVADAQLTNFLADSNNYGHIMNKGIWRYSRHPNYFGEITMWWALWLLALPESYGLAGIVSPLLISYLLMYVSGIPLAEKQMSNLIGYETYKKTTSMLIPWKANN